MHSKQSFKFILPAILPSLALNAQAAEEPAEALEPMVVTATRSDTPLKRVGSAITVITGEEIARRQIRNVADALRTVPGVDVVRTGGAGQQSSVFMRGADSRHTLVLIDGMELNDPSNPGGLFDFANLQTDDIEKIEVLRGGESSLYGSDAIGGVINIITRKGSGKPKANFSAEGGSYDTYRVQAGISGGERFTYNVSASHMATGGFSSADRRDGNRERDPFAVTTLAARLGWQANEQWDVDGVLRFNSADAKIDNCGGFSEFGSRCDDPNSRQGTEQLFTRAQTRLRLFDDRWEQRLGIAYSLTERRNNNPVDLLHPLDNRVSHYTGEKIKVDWQNNVRLHPDNLLTFGIENEEDRVQVFDRSGSAFGTFESNIPIRTANTTGYYAQDQLSLFERSFTTAAIRVDDHNRFGSTLTWRITQAFSITETGTRLRGSFGTGFKAPTLYQLFSPPTDFGPVGNAALRPEKSRGWDLGIDQELFEEKLRLGIGYFNNDFRNLIDFRFGSGFVNIASSESEGVESYVEAHPLENLTLRGTYTYTRTDDLRTHQPLLRRPNHKGSFDARYAVNDQADVSLNILLVGEKPDFNFDASRPVTVPGYVLVNLAGNYRVTDELQVYARIDNLLDTHYQEVWGYGTAGFAGYGGFKLTY